MVDPPLRDAPSVSGEGVSRDLQSAHADASPILHGEGDALRRSQRLACDLLSTLCARYFHDDVDPARAYPRMADLGECRLASDLDDDIDVSGLRIYAFLLPRRRKLVCAQRAVRQYDPASPHRPSRSVDHDGAEY